jgi:hypothetical protein
MTNDKKALSSVAGCVHALADQPSVKSRPAKLAWRFVQHFQECSTQSIHLTVYCQ